MPSGNKPVLTGAIQVRDASEPSGFRKIGKIALWVGRAKGSKAPLYTGNVNVGDTKASVSVWKADGSDAVEETVEEVKPVVKAPIRR